MPVDMNKRIRLQVRNAACDECRLSGHTEDHTDVCVTGVGPEQSDILIVSKSTGGRAYLDKLRSTMARCGLDFDSSFHTGAVKCRVFEVEASKKDLKACIPYLDREIELVQPKFILALGNEALFATCGKSGITKYRGQIFEHSSGAKVFPTISPAMVLRNPGMETGFIGDLNYFASLVSGRNVRNQGRVEIRTCMTKDSLRAFALHSTTAVAVAFDIESTGFDEWAEDAAIVSISGSFLMPDESIVNFAVPLFHPQSPFRKQWETAFQYVAKAIGNVPKRIAHNGKFDLRWMRRFGAPEWPLTFDTMIAAHLLDESRQKGLKELARMLLGADAWAIETKNLLHTPLSQVLEYNGGDTYWTLKLWQHLKPDFLKQPRLARVMAHLMVPASEEVLRSEIRGAWIDRPLMMANWEHTLAEKTRIEAELMQWVPDDAPYPVNFNPSNFLRWWLFDHLKLPVLARGKPKDDGRPGDPSTAEAVMMALREFHEAPSLLLERVRWNKYDSSFFRAYYEQMDAHDRVRTTYKLTGTVTGRLSSGKDDSGKVTGRKQSRGLNMQQVPRDKTVRGIFGAPPGWFFVQADQSQVELRIAAESAQERNMIRHYREGKDLHTAMAERMMGKTKDQILSDPELAPRWKEIRKRAKPVNFGYLYGMSWRKFQQTAWVNYGLRFTDEEAQGSRQAFFDMWADLPAWHAKQKRLAHKYKRVVSPLGRIRHLPDIDSPNREVMAEAERQAINSPVQSLASDLTLLALTLISQQFRRMDMRASVVGTVHDAINFEIPEEEMTVALPIIKTTMENPPLEDLFGYSLRVPLVADVSVGHHWGGAQELTADQVFNFTPTLLEAA